MFAPVYIKLQVCRIFFALRVCIRPKVCVKMLKRCVCVVSRRVNSIRAKILYFRAAAARSFWWLEGWECAARRLPASAECTPSSLCHCTVHTHHQTRPAFALGATHHHNNTRRSVNRKTLDSSNFWFFYFNKIYWFHFDTRKLILGFGSKIQSLVTQICVFLEFWIWDYFIYPKIIPKHWNFLFHI